MTKEAFNVIIMLTIVCAIDTLEKPTLNKENMQI